MSSNKTLFDLPTDPEEFGVLLAPADLRKIDFSALEFKTARRAVIEYIKTYFPNDFNDFVSNNGVIMLVELLAYQTAVLSLRSDLLSNEAFLPTAATEDAVINHLALIGQSIKTATPATTDIECSVSSPVGSDIHIPAGLTFTVSGEDDDDINYQIYRSPTNLIDDIVIPSGKRSTIAYGLEGLSGSYTITSDGSANQEVVIIDNVLEKPISVEITDGNITEEWNQIDHIERAETTGKNYEVQFLSDRAKFIFGDDVTGQIPDAGTTINISYRIGGGTRGKIGAGVIYTSRSITPEYPYTAPVTVTFRNVAPSFGGTDKESLEDAKRRGPRDAAVHNSVVTSTDYAQYLSSFSHPVFGSVSKAVATIRTGLNANLVELYVLTEGANGPAAPSQGLKRAVQSAIDEINALTDSVEVLDGKIKAVDVKATVVMSKNADASIVKSRVTIALDNYFKTKNWDMGEGLYVSKLTNLLGSIDGVKYVDIFEPSDNILPSNETNTSDDNKIDVNELITLGNQELDYYYEA